MSKLIVLLILLMGTTVFADSPEMAVKVDGVEKSTATVRLFSTAETTKPVNYDLYTIEKVNGKWKKKMWLSVIIG